MSDEISFKPDADIHDEISSKLDDIKTKDKIDKIKLRNKIANEPPDKNVMSVNIEEGVYQIDLRALLDAQIADCPATVIPMLIDHGVRTAVDIKDTYKPEKRTLRFEYWWILVLMIIMIAGLWFAMTIFGGG